MAVPRPPVQRHSAGRQSRHGRQRRQHQDQHRAPLAVHRRGRALLPAVPCIFTISFFNNRALENRGARRGARHLVGRIDRRRTWLRSTPCASWRRCGSRSRRWSKYQREGAPWSYRWGLYVGDDLYPEARRIYFDRFQQLLFGADAGRASCRTCSSLPGTPGPGARVPADLRRAEGVPDHHVESRQEHQAVPHAGADDVVDQRPRRWIRSGTQLAQKQFDFYAEELKEDESVLAGERHAWRSSARAAT